MKNKLDPSRYVGAKKKPILNGWNEKKLLASKIRQLQSYFRSFVMLTKDTCSCHFLLYILSIISSSILRISTPPSLVARIAAAAPGSTPRGGRTVHSQVSSPRKLPQGPSPNHQLSGHRVSRAHVWSSQLGLRRLAGSWGLTAWGWGWGSPTPQKYLAVCVQRGWILVGMEKMKICFKYLRVRCK